MQTREYVIGPSGTEIVEVSDTSIVQVNNTSGGNVVVSVTLKEILRGEFSGGTVVFADANPDTITRDRGSWIDDRFAVDQVLTITDTVSNNVATYQIAAITDTELTLVGGDAVTAETVVDPTITGLMDTATMWHVDQTVATTVTSHKLYDPSPTGFKFTNSGVGNVIVWVHS